MFVNRASIGYLKAVAFRSQPQYYYTLHGFLLKLGCCLVDSTATLHAQHSK